MRILYFNNCWFTNVGESFIDIGGMKLTKEIWGDEVSVACISAMTDYYCQNAPRRRNSRWIPNANHIVDSFKMSNYLNADYVILPGMCGTMEYLNAPSRRMIDVLTAKGCKVIFLGLGCEQYNKEETEALKKYFDAIQPALITSRDNETYELFKNVVPCVKGIDCAFWSIDSFDPRGFIDNNYEVITFNRISEPDELQNHIKDVVRPWHMQYQYRYEDYREKGFISDSPYDYLTLYANAQRVYTDLVHATIVSLMYETPVKYWRTDKRCRCLYALEGLRDDGSWLQVSSMSLKEQKNHILLEIKKILE